MRDKIIAASKVVFFILCFSPALCSAQKKLVDTYRLNTKDQKTFTFSLSSQSETPAASKDTVIVRFTFSLLGEGEEEKMNENYFAFKMKYTRVNVVVAINNLPDNIINKLRLNTGGFPASTEGYCKEKILKLMGQTFKIIDGDTKLKRIGSFE
jgi:hypothetical protein